MAGSLCGRLWGRRPTYSIRCRLRHRTALNNKDGTRVHSHTRSAHWARSKAAWAGTGFAGLSASESLLEFGFTLISTVCVVLIALLTGAAVLASGYVEKNR